MIVDEEINKYSDSIVYHAGLSETVIVWLLLFSCGLHFSILSVVMKFSRKSGGPMYFGVRHQWSAKHEMSMKNMISGSLLNTRRLIGIISTVESKSFVMSDSLSVLVYVYCSSFSVVCSMLMIVTFSCVFIWFCNSFSFPFHVHNRLDFIGHGKSLLAHVISWDFFVYRVFSRYSHPFFSHLHRFVGLRTSSSERNSNKYARVLTFF